MNHAAITCAWVLLAGAAAVMEPDVCAQSATGPSVVRAAAAARDYFELRLYTVTSNKLDQFERKKVAGKVLITRKGSNARISGNEVKLSSDLP